MQAHFIPSGTRSEQESLEELFLANQEGATAHPLWPSGQVSALCTGSLLKEWSLSFVTVVAAAMPSPTLPACSSLCDCHFEYFGKSQARVWFCGPFGSWLFVLRVLSLRQYLSQDGS